MNQQPETPAARPDAWRSLDELADTPEFRDHRDGEFPLASAHLEGESLDRRHFLQIMAASAALGGLAGCRRPVLEILPYSRKPEEIVPGLPTFYATTIPRPGGGFPILIETSEGRPTKIEGHPEHPHSLGRTDVHAQSAILDLYDPDRSTRVLNKGDGSSMSEFESAADKFISGKFDRTAFLVEDISSPALALLAAEIAGAKWFVHEPLGGNANAGLAQAYPRSGEAALPVIATYDLEKADVIVSLDADLFGLDERAVTNIRGFAANRTREVKEGNKTALRMNRLYAIETQLTVTGSVADNRLPLAGSAVAGYAAALASAVLAKLKSGTTISASKPAGVDQKWIDEVADDLVKNKGKCVVAAGPRQPAVVHALAALLNEALGSVGDGKAVLLRERKPVLPGAGSLADLAQAVADNKIDTLVIVGANPVLTSPGSLDFKKVKQSIHLGLYADETAVQCTWHVPMTHFLEAWGDVAAFDGTYSVVQPAIAPLHPETRSALQLLKRWTKKYRNTSEYDIVFESFRTIAKGGADLKAFKKVIHQGFLASSVGPAAKDTVNKSAVVKAAADVPKPLDSKELELSFHGDYRVVDGRFTNNGWLLETPDPVSKLTWDNAALVGPATAKGLSVETGDLVKIETKAGSVEIPIFVQPGQTANTISVHFGYGRARTGRVSKGAGFDVYPLRGSDSTWFTTCKVSKTGKRYKLASTQNHGNMTENSKLKSEEGRVKEIAKVETLSEFEKEQKEKKEGKHHEHHPLPLITYPKYEGQYQWGMVIDLNRCVGCNACQVACQAENNVPIVGKGEILRGRELYWIRIDRYYTGKEDNPVVRHQPVACVHCESAPCETVCPVNATVHSPEGLNVQVYNRCIGTRYCANNCPYKVRRFNWFDYHQRPLDQLRLGPLAPKGKAETLKMQMNPDVTVRMRGVMERCSYCIQRIERGKIDAKVKNPDKGKHPIADGAIVPACAQACPAEAIVFGDLKNDTHRVGKLKKHERHYVLLESVGTKPRTTYLSRLRNPNEALPNA